MTWELDELEVPCSPVRLVTREEGVARTLSAAHEAEREYADACEDEDAARAALNDAKLRKANARLWVNYWRAQFEEE